MELAAVLTPAEEGGYIALNPETGTITQRATVEEAIATCGRQPHFTCRSFRCPRWNATMSFMDILAISGSLRFDSSNTALLRALQAIAPPGLQIALYEGLAGLPPFDPGLKTEAAPVPVQALRAQISAAEGVIICTPEYAHGMPGILKNALEWTVASGEFVEKPVAALSTSPGATGGEKALAWLTQTLTVMSARIVPEISQPIPFGRNRVKPDGGIVDPALAETLRKILDGLIHAVEARDQSGSQP